MAQERTLATYCLTSRAARQPWTALGLLAGMTLLAGCGSPPAPPSPPATAEPADVPTAGAPLETPLPSQAFTEPSAPVAKAPEGPFTPPPLAELDAHADWQPGLLIDPLEQLREAQAKSKPTLSVAEALQLRNTSPEHNTQIVDALGRLPASDGEVDYDAVINRHTRADIKSSNPIMMNSTVEFDVIGLIGLTLFGFDGSLNPWGAKEVLASWHTSRDRLYDKVVLRDDLTWSDGTPVTAHDVAFSFETIMNPKVPVPAVRSGTDELRGVHAYDDRTVVFFHKRALATNVWNINFPIIPKHAYEKSLADDPTLQNSDYHVQLENAPICGGPYVISKRVRQQEIVLTRRESWFLHEGRQVRAKPYFKEVRFQIIEDPNTALLALKNGEIDELMLTAEQWTTQTSGDDFYAKNTKASGVEWTSFHFVWNVQSPFFSDRRVRQAMSYAYDHEEMLKTLNYGLYEPSNGIFHHTAWMAARPPLPYYKQDLDKAEELLAEAGWADTDNDGILDKTVDGKKLKFEFTMLCMNVPDRVKYCTLLKENLGQIGITCNVKTLEFTALTDQVMKHDFQAAFGGWGTGTDPDTSKNIWKTGEGRNFGAYSNSEVDRLYELGLQEFDRSRRAQIYGTIQRLLYEDQPYTWLYFRNAFYAFNKQLRGYNFSPRGPYHYGPGFLSLWKAKS